MEDYKKDVPYIVYESEAARHERTVKRLLIALLITIVLMVGTNMAWLYVWNQYDFSSETYTIENEDGNANYLESGMDGTVGPIAIALALDGEPIQTSRAIVTPAAVDEYFNVTSTAIITVPKGCCENLTVENVSFGATAADAPTAINVQNANLTVTRIA